MHRIFKTFHLIGLTLFLGSILDHIVAGVAGGAPGTASFLYAREQIALATQFLTLPGSALSVASGVALMAFSRLSPLRNRWLAAKIVLTIVVMANSALVLAPAGAMAEILAARSVEDFAGAANILLILAIMLLGVFKPRFESRARRANTALSTNQRRV